MRAFSVVIAIAALTIPTVAMAQPTQQATAAEVLFEEGKRLMDAGNYTDACPKLAESQRLEPGAGTLLNLGACYEKQGLTASAWVTYREATSAADTTQRKAWAAQAMKRATAIEATLSRVTIVVTDGSIDGLTVKRDGQLVRAAEWGVAVPLDPGKHTVEATAPNRKSFTTSIEITAPSSSMTVTVPVLDAEAIAPPPPPPPPPPVVVETKSSAWPVVGLGIAGVGVAGVVVGAVFGSKASGTFDRTKPHCKSDYSSCDSVGLSRLDEARTQARLSTVFFIAGPALIASGAVLFFATRSKRTSGRLDVAPFFGAANGLTVRSTW